METLSRLNALRRRTTTQGNAEKLVRDVRMVVQGAEELIKATAGDIEDRTRQARARLAGALVVAKESLQQTEQAAALRASDGWVRENPYPAIGAGVIVGLLFGILLSRR